VIAVGMLVRDGRVLLAHGHPRRAWYPDCWDLVGGHVEAGGSAEDALRREFREEIGARIDQAEPWALEFTNPDVEAHCFRVTRWTGAPATLCPEEHDDLKWFAAKEVGHLRLAEPAACRASSRRCARRLRDDQQRAARRAEGGGVSPRA
jgi:8-oxo-dGTP pyrophosphatase MutT (NUDIX family)